MTSDDHNRGAMAIGKRLSVRLVGASLARPPSRKIADRAPSTRCDEASWISDGFDGGWPSLQCRRERFKGSAPSRRLRKVCKADVGWPYGRDVPSIVCATRGPWPLTVAECSFIGARELVLSMAGI